MAVDHRPCITTAVLSITQLPTAHASQKGVLVISSTSNNARQRFFICLYVAIGCGIFSATYEHFSHGVYSSFMVWLFATPLVLGALPNLIMWLRKSPLTKGYWWPTLHAYAIATLTIGSALQGIVEIYGTTSPYIIYFFIVGLLGQFASATLFFKQLSNTTHML